MDLFWNYCPHHMGASVIYEDFFFFCNKMVRQEACWNSSYDTTIFISKFCKEIFLVSKVSLTSRGASSSGHQDRVTRHWLFWELHSFIVCWRDSPGSDNSETMFEWEEIHWLWLGEHSWWRHSLSIFSSSYTTNAFDYFRTDGTRVDPAQRLLMLGQAVCTAGCSKSRLSN